MDWRHKNFIISMPPWEIYHLKPDLFQNHHICSFSISAILLCLLHWDAVNNTFKPFCLSLTVLLTLPCMTPKCKNGLSIEHRGLHLLFLISYYFLSNNIGNTLQRLQVALHMLLFLLPS